jgi:haloalkane dehalogenase
MTPEIRAGYLRPYDSWAHRVAVLRFVQDIPLMSGDPGYDLVTATQNGLGRLQDVPMLICWGMRDFVFDHHFLAEWERCFPKAEVHRYSDAGHYVLEDAAEEIIPRVCQFLSPQPLPVTGS